MRKEVVSDRQAMTLLILYIFGSTLVMGTAGKAERDNWIAIIVGIILSVPIMLVYARILSSYPGMNLYEISEVVFGRITGRVIMLVYVWFSFHLGALVLRNIGDFINTVGLQEVNEVVPITIFALICCIGVKNGIETLAKCSSHFISITVFLIIVLNLLTINIMDPHNLLPVFENGIRPVLQGAFAAISFPFAELVVFLAVLDSLDSPKTISKVFLKALVLGGAFVVFIAARNIMVLGADTAATVYFPSYTATSRINVGNFLQRLEISVSIVFLLSSFIKISICLLAASKGLTKLFGYKDYRLLVCPVALLMVNLSVIVYDSIMEMFEWAQELWPYYAFPFQVILPIAILVAIEIKARFSGNKGDKKEETPV